MRADGERLVDLAARQDLDRPTLADEAVLEQGLRVDLALEHLAERAHVHDGLLDAVRVREALELGHAALERHLATLEPRLRVVARAPALGAPARGLAPRAVLLGALRGLEVMQLHDDVLPRLRLVAPPSSLPSPGTSSTRTRWCTLAIMPRISGRSSLITQSRIRCSPRRRTVCF